MPADLPRRIGWRTGVVRWLVRACVAALALALWLILRAKGETAGLVLPTAAEEVQAGLAVWIGLQAGLLVAVLVWMHAAVTNAEAMAPNPDRIGPWMAVIWWFVPVFHFFQPVRVMSQTWNTSVDRNPDINGTAAASVAGWWLLCAVGVLWLPSALMALMADPALDAIYAHVFGLSAALVVWIGGMGCLSSSVTRIARAQTAPGRDPDPAPPAQAVME